MKLNMITGPDADVAYAIIEMLFRLASLVASREFRFPSCKLLSCGPLLIKDIFIGINCLLSNLNHKLFWMLFTSARAAYGELNASEGRHLRKRPEPAKVEKTPPAQKVGSLNEVGKTVIYLLLLIV
jgi:hypothetical protein